MAQLDRLTAHIGMVLSSLRISMDRRIQYPRARGIDLDEAAEIAGSIEKVRFKFLAESGRVIGSEVGVKQFEYALSNLFTGLSELNDNSTFRIISSDITFRLNAPIRDQNTSVLLTLEPRFDSKITVYEASILLQETCDRILRADLEDIFAQKTQPVLEFEPNVPSTREAIRDLKRIVPAQKIAPIKFKIVDDVISIEDFQSSSRDSDKKNIADAKAEILDNGKRIVEHLKKSNCDRRLVENIENLHKQIENDSNAIQLGMGNISFGMMSEVFNKELPDAVNAMLNSHNLSINMYVAQFPEWIKFSENAASAELTISDVEKIRNNSDFITAYLENNEDIAEPRVVKSFKKISDLVKNPGQASKRAIFAVIRTIENLISKIFDYTIEFFEQTVKETIKSTAKATGKAISISLLTLAINSSSELISLSPKLRELSWLKNAITIVQKQINTPKSHN